MTDTEELSVAIVGMACRLPGASDPASFWHNLTQKICSIKRFSAEEMRASSVPEAMIRHPDFVPAHGFLEGYDQFDAAYFGIGVREAELMDPQHRLLLECAAEALQDAGLEHPESRRRQLAGVFASVTISTYFAHNVLPRTDLRTLFGDQQFMLACDKDFAALRVAHAFDLRGPAMAIQVACASSLVAISVAMRSLLSGECDIALAGGASVRSPQVAGYLYTEGGTGSRDGICRAFDAAASGSVAGSGAGIVVLKRLGDALADGSRIHAIVRGAAVTNDGANKPNFVVPTVAGQAEAMRQALDFAQVRPEQVSLLEAHGTGTLIGDPIEIAAFATAYPKTDGVAPAFLGTVKPSIGHLDAAAGVAGLIRATLSLQNRQAPPVYGFQTPNPDCRLDETRFVVPTDLQPLANGDEPLFAAVHSIGMGGVNAHIILESPPRSAPRKPPPKRVYALPISAKTSRSLAAYVERLRPVLSAEPNLSDVEFTLQRGRAPLKCRAVALGRSAEALLKSIEGASPVEADADNGAVVFVFSGQAGVGFEDLARLATEVPCIAAEVETILDAASDYFGQDLRWIRGRGEPPAMANDLHRQIAVFAGPLAMARALARCGVKPDVTAGYSMGEIAAACVSGMLDLEGALLLLKARADAFAKSPAGAMLVAASEGDSYVTDGVWPAIRQGGGRTVYGGVPEAIEGFTRRLDAASIAHVRVKVPHAFHTPLMEDAPRLIEEALRGKLILSEPAIPFVGAFRSGEGQAPAASEPAYWWRQVTAQMRFDLVLGALAAVHPQQVVDLGPAQSAAPTLARSCGCAPEPLPPAGDWSMQFFHHLAQAWRRGVSLEWPAPSEAEDPRIVSLPYYAFDHRRYWLDHAAETDQESSMIINKTGETVTRSLNTHVTIYPDRVEICTGSAIDAPAPNGAAAAVPQAQPSQSAQQTAAEVTTPAPSPAQSSPDDLDAAIKAIATEFLGLPDLGAEDNLVDLGANSLIMTQMIAQIRNRLNVEIALADVFVEPTIANIQRLAWGQGRPAKQRPSIDPSLVQAELESVEKMSPEEVQSALRDIKNGR